MDEQQVLPQEMSVEDAMTIIGIGTDVTPEEVLRGFRVHFDAHLMEDESRLIEAKNVFMRHLVSKQMEKQRYFEIISPFEDSCVHCHGSGEIYKFNKKTVFVNCHICASKKKVTVRCRSCDGSGRYIRRFKDGGGINVSCRTCKGTGKARVKCSNCRGKGKIKKIVPDHTIKSTTPCKYCEERGFTSNEPLKKKEKRQRQEAPLHNPVLSHEQAVGLYQMINDTEVKD